jgi:hypothetical protein
MKAKIKKYSLIIFGFIIFSLYFWNRFLRYRTSKMLPLDLSLLRFLILIYICGIFTIILISLIRLNKPSPIIDKVIDWLFIPIVEFYKYFKNLPFIKPFHERFLDYIIPKLHYFIIQTPLFFIIFWLFPRLVLLSALFIDIFLFHQLHYKYQVIFVGLLLFFNRCFKYCLKISKNDLISFYELYIKFVHTPYIPYVMPSELEPDFDPNDPEDGIDYSMIGLITMSLPLKIFIEFQTESIVYQNITRKINMTVCTSELRNEYWIKYAGGPDPDSPPKDYKNNFGDKSPDNYYTAQSFIFEKKDEFGKAAINKIMGISLLLEYYDKTSSDPKIRTLKILIYFNYLLCWLYVLIFSLPSIHIYEILLSLLLSSHSIHDPFSGTFM